MYADILSLVAMVSSEQEDSNESLLDCLKGSRTNLGSGGHEDLRSLGKALFELSVLACNQGL